MTTSVSQADEEMRARYKEQEGIIAEDKKKIAELDEIIKAMQDNFRYMRQHHESTERRLRAAVKAVHELEHQTYYLINANLEIMDYVYPDSPSSAFVRNSNLSHENNIKVTKILKEMDEA